MSSVFQQARVKSIISGDTIVLSSVSNPRNERVLSLAYVTAPRMRRGDDEKFALESREFLRRVLVGRVVQFRVLYTIPAGNREYGQLTLIDGHQFPETNLAEGFVKLREDAARRDDSEETDELVEKFQTLEARAKSEGKGIWNTSTSSIRTVYEISDVPSFTEKHKNIPIRTVVEKILTGDRLIVRFMDLPEGESIQTILVVAGIRAPSTRRVDQNGKESPGEPYGQEALDFVEARLMHRTVAVTILGRSPQNQLIGTVVHRVGDIAIHEIKAGLARCFDAHSTLLGPNMASLREAERYAKENKLGLYKDHVAPKIDATGQADVVVGRVQTADTLYVRYPNGMEKRVNFSSIRQPKPSDEKQAPFGTEAKEYMRKRLIGKHVRLSIDGKRPGTEGFEEREMVTIIQNNRNVALDLVQEGYASVLRHRSTDTDRSPIYDDLLAAEQTAILESKGMWSTKAPETKQYVDYSENLEKAKRLLSLLSIQKRVPAIVDFVKGGSRFSLLIPRENAKLTLVLSGVQVPKSARSAQDTAEPFGKEAHELANKRCQQRDVEIEVEDNDKAGGFIGKLFVNRENFAKILIDEGLASVRVYSAEKAGNANELLTAEQKAKDAHRGMWHDYDPSQDVDADAGIDEDQPLTNGAANGATSKTSASVQQAPPSTDYRDVVLTHVDDSCRLRMQLISPSTTGALEKLMQSFQSFHISPATATSLPGPDGAPKAGDYVSAKFSEDDKWYRARVRRNDRDAKSSEIVYVDYGNNETLPWSGLRPLPTQFGINALKTQGIEAAFSFVQFPSGSIQYMREAQDYLYRRLVNDKPLVARVDHNDARDGTLWVSLFDPESESADKVETRSINDEIVEQGLAMVGRKPSRWEKAQEPALAKLREKEEEAKTARMGMWEYGDLAED